MTEDQTRTSFYQVTALGTLGRERFARLACLEEVTDELTSAMRAEEPTETEVFASLYATQYGPLVRLAVLLTGSTMTAEDIVQDAFAKLHNRFNRVDTPKAWLRVVVVNACTNERRRLGTARRFAPQLVTESKAPNREVPELLASLTRLPERQRAVVVLRYYLDLPEAEIAEALGIRLGTVKSSLHRAMARLSTEVER